MQSVRWRKRGEDTGNRNIEDCSSVSGGRQCQAYLGHCQCRCQGERAKSFMLARAADRSACFVQRPLSTLYT